MIESELLADGDGGIRHGFFTRQGGVSEGIYASLNCGLGSADAQGAVAENRARVARRLGGDPARRDQPAFDLHRANAEELIVSRSSEQLSASHRTRVALITAHQIHSPRAVIADSPWPGPAPQADAVVTRTPGLAVGVLTADCAPVLFVDREARVVAAAHAGWRGALSGVLEAALAAMESIGARRERIRAAVGPCISQPAYEVGREFRAAFLDAGAGNAAFFKDGADEAHFHFDLPAYCIERLEEAGVTECESLGRCTYANESLFFSFRRSSHRNEADYGRQISAMLIL